jgi:alcohol dehydrogenase (cytochrome c)
MVSALPEVLNSPTSEEFMLKSSFLVLSLLSVSVIIFATQSAQNQAFPPVTDQMLANPSPDDWLMYSRTYDAQRYSPLKQITKENVGQLKLAFSTEMKTGTQESIPIVYRGVIYVANPGSTVQAIDGTSGKVIWEYKRPTGMTKTKGLAMYQDMIYYTAPEGVLVALDARNGSVRWEQKIGEAQHTSGPIVVEGKVIAGRACARTRESCFISANDARTGEAVWKFQDIPGPGEPGAETWGPSGPADNMMASTWALMGSFDPVRRVIYWGVANPMPNTRMERHNGDPAGTAKTAPADLYSNSTVALDPATGKLKWYYQHLPGDDWDQDYTNERVLFRTAVSPDSKYVKWINPDVRKGEQHDVSVNVGEGGGIWALDRNTGQFLWSNPFPYDNPNFLISDIEAKTGRVTINYDLVMKKPGDHHVICFWNTKSYWPMSYHPGTNSMYVPFNDNCLDMTAKDGTKPERRGGSMGPRAMADPNFFGGIAKVNMTTGETTTLYNGKAPSNGATLSTAGGLVFWGDLDRHFFAFDAETGKILWQTTMDAPIQNSTITYAVNGKQYVAVLGGLGGLSSGLLRQAGLQPVQKNGLYVFALP